MPMDGPAADVIDVAPNGFPGRYTYTVTVNAEATGCSQYADWWEVLGADGTLLHRHLLNQSYADTQPFTTDGGPVDATSSQQVYVRAHMSTGGFFGRVMRGSAAGGFAVVTDPPAFPADLETRAPQPGPCAF